MNCTRTDLSASRIELSVTVSAEEMLRFAKLAATRLSEQTKIEGFRPGKAPYETVRARMGDMAIYDEASRVAVSKTIDEALTKNISEDWVGQPEITISKLAPDNDFEYKILVTLLPKVVLGEYKNLGIVKEELKISDDEIAKVIDHLSESRIKETSVERPAQLGDKLISDIFLSLDNVPLEGGQGKDVAIVLGKEYIVPGFDDHVVGIEKGQERNFELHYPADHSHKQLAGKKVMFKVKAKDIFERVLPEINDGFALDFGVKSMEELKKNIRHSVEHEKKHEIENKYERAIIEAAVAKAQISEVPDALVESEARTMLQELEQNVISSGGVFSDYLTSINKTPGAMLEEFKPQALDRVKASLVLRSIVKEEKISVADEDISKELEMLKKRYAQDAKAMESITSPAYRRHIEAVLLNRAVITKLVSLNTPV